MAKLTGPQIKALEFVRNFGASKPCMPYVDQARSFEACERRGLLVYRSVDQGFRFNGYELTDAGRAVLVAPSASAQGGDL